MKISKSLFMSLSLVLFFLFLFSIFSYSQTSGFYIPLTKSILYTIALGGLVWTGEFLFKKLSLRILNLLILSLFVGCCSGKVLYFFGETLFSLSPLDSLFLNQNWYNGIFGALFFIGFYLGTTLTLHFSHQFLLSIPFIKLTPTQVMRRDIYLDLSALADPRILDLALTGLLDHLLVLPRCILKEIHKQADSHDEAIRAKGRRALDILKKIEALPNLHLRYDENEITNSVGGTDLFQQLLCLAKIGGAQILVSEASPTPLPPIGGVKLINIHSISHSLKPLMQAGEALRIKIQRYGKEPNQGVGYLEDGTMVVVNGGGAFIEKTIETQVLSVKHTSSGRMIFCNTLEMAEPTLNQSSLTS